MESFSLATQRYELSSPPSSSSFLDRDPSREGLFGQGDFLEEGDDLTRDSYGVSPDGCANTLVAVKEEGLEEVPVSLEGRVFQQEDKEEGTWEESCKFLGFR